MAKKIIMTGWIMSEHGVQDSYVKVIEEVPPPEGKPKRAWWKCECLLCGTSFNALGANLRNGKIRSCGKHRLNFNNDLIGKKFGSLTAIENTKKISPDGHAIWKCKCDCGAIIEVNRARLLAGNKTSCGCFYKYQYNKNTIKNTISPGKIFGRLTVIQALPERKNGAIMYLCECECGNKCKISGTNLRRGVTKSCGCLVKENGRKRAIDLTNQTFGLLTAKESLHQTNANGNILWKCICSCGNTCIISAQALVTGNTISCGCFKSSYGEKKIEEILKENNYKYIHDKSYFKDLRGDKNEKLRYDFIIFNKDRPIRLIEFDGPQHEKSCSFYGGEEYFLKLKHYDMIKNSYAFKNKIPLIRIPYYRRNNITIEDIIGDEFLIKQENV